MEKTNRVKHLSPGEGKAFWVAGELVIIKASGEETNGAYSLTEEMWPPEVGPPSHIHHTQDATFYVLEGEMEFVMDEDTIEATTGSLVHIPKGTLRTYKNMGAGPARAIVIFTPGGFEGFFEAVGEPAVDASASPTGEQDLERLVAVAAKYGCEIPPFSAQ